MTIFQRIGIAFAVLLGIAFLLFMVKIFSGPEDPITTKGVVRVDLVLPAKGSVTTKKLRRCAAWSISNPHMQENISNRDQHYDVTFFSNLPMPVNFTVWFFDDGGHCTKDSEKIDKLGLFK